MTSCPTPEHLQVMLTQPMGEREERDLAAHLAQCAACRAAMARLSDDPDMERWVRLLREKQPAPSPLSRFLQTLRDSPPAMVETTTSDSPPEPIRFPGPATEQGPLGQLGPYRIRRQLGGGAFGFVYEALDSVDRIVALKVLRPELAASPTQRARFEREVRAAVAIKHEHVVTIYEVGHAPDFALPYFVMEYVDGDSLRALLEREGPPDTRTVARLVRDVAIGLAAAHAQGIMHRDIKPTNILLERAGGRVKITDFGLARPIEIIGDTLSDSGRMAGTPAYMSPEQIASPGHVDVRTDIYSLGVVLYELLTGERLFRGDQRRVFEQIVHDDPRPPRRISTAIPRDLETICLKAIAKDPSRRYQTASEFADDLERWVQGRPITARPVRVWERGIKWARRRPAVTGLLTALLVTIVTAFAIVVWKWRDAEHQRQQAVREQERANRNFVWARKAAEDTMAKLLENIHFREGPLQELHEDLLASAVAFYEDFVQQKGDDFALEADRGRAYWRLGFVRSHRGQKVQALADFQHMETIFARLVTAVPTEPEYRGLYAWSMTGQGNMLRDLGRFAEADHAYQRALGIFEKHKTEYKSHPGFAVMMGATCMNVGTLARKTSRFEEASDWCARALAILEPLQPPEGQMKMDRFRFVRETYEEQGRIFVRLNRWNDAVAAFQRLMDLHPNDPNRWYECAIAHLGAGDREKYRKTCRSMFDRFGNTQSPQIAERILYACLPVADALPDSARLVPLAELAARSGKWNRRVLGAALCRAGSFKESISSFEEAAPAEHLRGWDFSFLAIVHHRAGNAEQAVGYLKKARRWVEQHLQADPFGEGKRWGWTERAETETLLHEANITLGVE